MALKAGRVGVHPSQVDRSGKISGGGVDAYTKAEADAKFGTKEELATKADSAAMTEALAAKANTADVTEALAAKADAASVVTALAAKADQSNLTANDNDFIFAYDSTTQKYGYKAGGADTFHPFKEGAPDNGHFTGTWGAAGTSFSKSLTLPSGNHEEYRYVVITSCTNGSGRTWVYNLVNGSADTGTQYNLESGGIGVVSNNHTYRVSVENGKLTVETQGTISSTVAGKQYMIDIY